MGKKVVWEVAAVMVIASLHLQFALSQMPSLPPNTPANTIIPPPPSLPSTPPVDTAIPPPPSIPSTPPVNTAIPPPPSKPSTPPSDTKVPPPPSIPSPPPVNTKVPPPPSLPSTPPVNSTIPPPPSLPSTPPVNSAIPPPPSLPSTPPVNATPPINTAAPPLPSTPPINVAAPPLHAAPPISLSVPPLSAPPLPAVPSISPVAPTVNTNRSQSSPETYTVGETLGWTVPRGGAAIYTAWVTGKTFLVGDTLLFNFTTGNHDVARVTKAGFDSCGNSSNYLIGSLITKGPAKVVLEAEGEHYYICTFTKHCQMGQKLVLNITGTASPPSVTPTSSPSPPSSAPYSSRVGFTGFFVTILTTTIVAFFV